MNVSFAPAKRRGLTIHIGLITTLLLAMGVSALNLYNAQLNLRFTIFLLVFLAALAPLPLLAYRTYALIRADYTLDRNLLRLVWGMRVEDIPVSDVEWVRPAEDLTHPLNLPLLRLPGGIIGRSQHRDLGKVEFLAAERRDLILVATARQVFAISPADPAGFVAAFQKIVEMGSLVTGEAYSQYPSFVIADAWDQPFVRRTWLVSIFLNIGLLVWAGMTLPGLQQLPMGFDPLGRPLEPSAAGQLALLPLLSATLNFTGWLAGLFFYRRKDQHMLSYTLWISGAVSSFIFLLAIFFIVTTPI